MNASRLTTADGEQKSAGPSRNTASYAGLTRVSIRLRKSLSSRMDCRVKPGNDAVMLLTRLRAG
jgi:hypothetical protein